MKLEAAQRLRGAETVRSRVAVVTGAARGIGRASAIALANAGVDICGIDICGPVDPRSGIRPSTVEDMQETGRLVEETGRRWRGLKLDQRNIQALRTAAKSIVEDFGGIDILFANAGTQSFHPLLDMEDDDWSITIDTNLTGTANTIRAFAPYLVQRGGGRIIATASTQGQHGALFGSAYSASKWGIIGLVKSAAQELGPHGITVNALIPGLIDTPLTDHQERYAQVIQEQKKTPTGDFEKDKAWAASILAPHSPLGIPWLHADDVAPIVVFLASEGARLVSGCTYAVDGGDTSWNAV